MWPTSIKSKKYQEVLNSGSQKYSLTESPVFIQTFYSHFLLMASWTEILLLQQPKLLSCHAKITLKLLWWHMYGMDGILDAIFLTLTTKYDVRLNQSFSPKVSEKKRRMKSDFQFKLISWLSDPAVKDLPEMTNDQCCAQFQLKCTDPLKCEFLHIRQKTQPL